MDIEITTGIVVSKTTSKRIAQKTAKAKRDLIGNKIADKITSASKTKNNGKGDETNETEEIYRPLEKRQQIIDALRLFQVQYKNGISNNCKPIKQHT